MKRLVLVLSMLFFVGVSFAERQQLSSYETIILHVSITDPTKAQEPYKLGPVRIPLVEQDGHTIKFAQSCDGCTLILTNNDGDMEYVSIIPEGTTMLYLPSWLLGEYRINIIRGRICFWGYINL